MGNSDQSERTILLIVVAVIVFAFLTGEGEEGGDAEEVPIVIP